MINLVTIVLIVGFSFWILLSIINQFVHESAPFSNLDIFKLIPTWDFFSPIPLKVNYHLLYRDELENGCFTTWKDISPTIKRSPARFLFNPSYYPFRVLDRSVLTLIKKSEDSGGNFEEVEKCFAYRCLLNFVQAQQHAIATKRIQFLVLGLSPKSQSCELHIVSNRYPLC